MLITSLDEFKRRKKTIEEHYTMSSYLEDMKDNHIRQDQEVQRLAGQYSNELNNELIYTILCGNYLPPILLCENKILEKYIGDGLQRSTCFYMFKYGNYKITSKLRDSIVPYIDRKINDNGNVEVFINNFDISNKTYDMLPKELQKVFNDFTLTAIIFEDRSDDEIIDIVRTYNTNKSVNPAQKAFMNIGNYAKEIREILDKKFFIECVPTEKKDKSGYTESEKINGTMERVITESVMLINHFNNWKKQSKDVCDYLNEKSSMEEFESFSSLIDRLGKIYTKELGRRFTSKNSFIWFALFNKFANLNLPDNYFVDFITEFNKSLHHKVVNIKYKELKDITYEKLDNESGTKDKTLIQSKMEILESLMMEYLHIYEQKQSVGKSKLDFVRENVGQDIEQEDIECYEEMLEDLSLNVDNDTKLLEEENNYSLIAITAYSCQNDIDLDNWFIDYFKRNITYIHNQKQNYIKMRKDLEKYIEITEHNKTSVIHGGKMACAM